MSDFAPAPFFTKAPAAQQFSVLGIHLGLGLILAGLLRALVGNFGLPPLIWAVLGLMLGFVLLAGYLLLLQSQQGRRQAEFQQALEERRVNPQTLPTDPGARALLRQRLKSPYPGEAIYALDLLSVADSQAAQAALPDLLTHPQPQVRQEALLRLEKSLQVVDSRLLYILAEADDSAEVREVALRVYCRYAPLEEVLERIPPFLAAPEPPVLRGAVVGLLENGGGPGLAQGEQALLSLTQSPQASRRELAAQILGEVENKRFSSYLLQLFHDEEPSVQIAAILAAGKLNYPLFWSHVISKLGEPAFSSASASALFMANKTIYPSLEMAFNQPMPNRPLMRAIARLCGQRRDSQAQDLLRAQIQHPDRAVRYQVWRSLGLCAYQAKGERERGEVHQALMEEAAAVKDIFESGIGLEPFPAYVDLVRALDHEERAGRERILQLLGFLYPPDTIRNLKSPSPNNRGALLDLPKPLAQMIVGAMWPMISLDVDPEDTDQQAELRFLLQEKGAAIFTPWIQALALFHLEASPALWAFLEEYQESFDPLLRETALWRLYQRDPAAFINTHLPAWRAYKPYLVSTAERIAAQGENMLLLLEKVLILKSLGIFARVPDAILVELANLAQEVDLAAEGVLFEQGSRGDSMFVIVRGRLGVFADGRTVAERQDREFIGEMALFDEEARSATVKALQNTKLLQIDRRTFGELLASHPEVAMSILKVLSQRLREMMRTLPSTVHKMELYEQNLPTPV